ncbi:MAG TPA: hypothetical protein PLY87_21765 [Planctomycetaceae bacterium]|nr:hypothetical protein [Planctomycetaceae bacterium]
MNALRQLFNRLSDGTQLAGDDIIALALLLTMAASLAHLLTMLVTRWGDRNIALKSLLASLLIHGVCFLGLEVFEPLGSRKAAANELVVPTPEKLTEILVESDQDVNLPESGNTPIADRLIQPEIDLRRFEDTAPEIARPELADRMPDKLESLTTSVDDVTQFEERQMTELALPADSGAKGPKQVATEDPAADLKTAFEQSQADVFSPELRRMQPTTGRPDESERTVDPQRQLTAPEMKFEVNPEDIALNVATATDSSVILPPVTDDPAESIVRRTAPNAADVVIDGSHGQPSKSVAKSSASTFQSRLPRPSRSFSDRDSVVAPSRLTPDMPSTTTPITDAYDDVRIGDLAPKYSDSLLSGAALRADSLPTIRRRDNPPLTYKLRTETARRDAAERFGGTKESESAVERSLKWMAANQSQDGRWDAEDFGAGQVRFDLERPELDREFAGKEADTGLTALVTLSFLGAGYTHEEGRYAVEVDRAVDWLISQQAADGNLCGKAEHFARMYCHAMATYSLAEAYGMQKEIVLGPIIDPEAVRFTLDSAELAAVQIASGATSQGLLSAMAANGVGRRMRATQIAYSLRRVDDLRLRAALSKAVAFTISQQDPRSGGWRYKPQQSGDVSMLGWQLMSLKGAEIAGVGIPEAVKTRMNGFIDKVRQGKHGGLFGYRENVVVGGRNSEPVSPTMTAEALFCQQMLGYPRDTEASRESIAYLMRNPPRRSDMNYYYWYYGTLAMYQQGGRAWQDWNAIVRDVLISEQIQTGPMAGTWDPNDQWGRYGGRLYSTALATLTLEVYYRLLPLYRMNETVDVK